MFSLLESNIYSAKLFKLRLTIWLSKVNYWSLTKRSLLITKLVTDQLVTFNYLRYPPWDSISYHFIPG